jgi:hypothetical protein
VKVYLYALILTAVIAAVAEFLTDGDATAGAVRVVAGLCVLLAMAQPIKEGLLWMRAAAEGELEEWVSLPEADVDAEAVFREELDGITEQVVVDGVINTMKERFSVESRQCRVQVAVRTQETGQVIVESLTVILSGAAVLKNPRTIQAYWEQTLGCACTVAVE